MVGFAVSFDWSGRLRMAHFKQGCADGNSLLDVEEICISFSLCGVCHDGADSLALSEDWDIWRGISSAGGRGWRVAQILMACRTTA